MPTDAELLRQYARDRSEAAFAELVRRRIDLVYSAAVRRTGGDAHRAQEVTQDVFIALARRASALAEHPALGAWLYASVRNAALNQIRASQRRQGHEREAQAMSESATSSPARAWEQLRPVLDEAMDELAESDRRAIVLRFFEDRSYAELAAALALREDAARMRVARAVERLRLQLGRRGITSTAAALSGLLATHAVSSAPPGLSAVVAAAAAPTASLLWLKLLELMTTTKAALALGGAAILIIASAAYHNTLAATQLQSGLAAAQLGAQQANARVQALRRLPGAGPSLAGSTATEKTGGLRPATILSPDNSESVANAEALMAAHPEIRKAWAELRFGSAESGLADLLRGSSVILNTEQQHELLQALEPMQHTHNVFGGTGPKSYAFDEDPTADNTAAITALVGGDQAFQDLNRTSVPRNIASDLSAAALSEGTPMTGDQVQQVARILAESSQTYRQGQEADPETIDWDAAAAQAKGILSPAQQAAFDEERQQVQFNVAMRAANGSAH